MPTRHAKTPPAHRGFPVRQFKAMDEQHGTFSGYLAIFGNEDQVWADPLATGDIIEPGAFTKTLADMRARQATRLAQGVPSARYLMPIFWEHDDKDPVGGFTSLREDKTGLNFEAELDLDIDQGRRAFSGLTKGYLPGMSFGYFVVKAMYDGQGRRHLKELSVYEGTVTPIPMNEEALVMEIKAVTGKADWPLGDRATAWDNGAAHKRIVDWATADDGTVDTGKLKSVHFYSPDGDAADNISEYKLLFADVVGGDVKAMPKGIFACAGSHGVNNTTGISSADKDAIRGKISAYYKRMAKQFDDDSIVAPWDTKSGGKGKGMGRNQRTGGQRPAHLPQTKAADFSTTLTGMLQGDTLQREWAKTFDAFVSCMWSGLLDAKYPLTNPDGSTLDDPQDVLNGIVDEFGGAVKDLVARSIEAGFLPMLDEDQDSFADPDDEADDKSNGYMGVDTERAEQKAGRVMSVANHKAMGGLIGNLKKNIAALSADHKALAAFHSKLEPGGNGADTTQGDEDALKTGEGKSLADAAGDTDTTGAGRDTRDTTPLTADDVEKMIRQRIKMAQASERSA